MNRGAHQKIGAITPEHAEILRVAARVARAGGDGAKAARASGAESGQMHRIMQRYGFDWQTLGDWPDDEFQPAPAPVARPCITRGCSKVVASTGPHHRMCDDCRRGDYPLMHHLDAWGKA